jgi:hypothetical protein
MARPRSITVEDTRLQGPVPNQRCPACGNADSIFKETLTFPYTVDDALADRVQGISPWWRIVLPHRRTRMRCGKCHCMFPGRWPALIRLVLWGLLLAAVAAGALLAYPRRAQIMTWIADWFRNSPLVALTVAAVVLMSLFTILLVVLYPARKRPDEPPA